jgi:hypothetical protein
MDGMENVILAGENGTFDSILKSKYFIQAVKFWVVHVKVTVTPRFFVIIWWPPGGPVWLTLRTTNLGISTYVTTKQVTSEGHVHLRTVVRLQAEIFTVTVYLVISVRDDFEDQITFRSLATA